MSHDVVADALNMIKNANNAKKESVKISRISNLLIEILKIMKQEGAIKRYKIDPEKKTVQITIGELFICKAIKPRFTVQRREIEKYKRRFLPSKNMGVLIISTNKGLVTHEEAEKEKIGGCLIAYFY